MYSLTCSQEDNYSVNNINDCSVPVEIDDEEIGDNQRNNHRDIQQQQYINALQNEIRAIKTLQQFPRALNMNTPESQFFSSSSSSNMPEFSQRYIQHTAKRKFNSR